MTLSSADLKTIGEVAIRHWPDLWAVYLFGSAVAADGLRSDSDIDVAILGLVKPRAESILAMKAELSQHFRRDIDIVDLRRADTVTSAQVISTGLTLVDNRPFDVAQFETTVYSQYALLNEERAGILADIVARGRIYG